MEDNFNLSVETFSKLITQTQSADSYLYRATVYMKLGNYEEALKDLTEGEKKTKNSYEFQYKKGICLFHLEKFTEAHDNFVKAALIATSSEQRSNLDRWMSKTKLECPNLPSTESKTITKEVPVEKKTVQAPNTNKVNDNYNHQWFQNPNFIFVSLNSKTPIDTNKLNVMIEKRKLFIENNENNTVVYEIHLCNSIDTKSSKFDIKDQLISFNLKKEVEGFNWVTLEKENVKDLTSAGPSAYPTSAKVKKNWDEINKDIDLGENPEGGDAAMGLFKQIYQGSDEKVRLAMKKSFQTSGGTVLSTNWDEVKEKDYEGADRPDAPKGQEWSKY
jgi:suppressor of G2 allele of SKP1